MEPEYLPAPRVPVRKIPIAGDNFSFGNIEAWFKIIGSYYAIHPMHQVILHYLGEPVPSVAYLFKLGKDLDCDGFAVTVAAHDRDFTHVPKLHRLLVEAAGPEYDQFLSRELYQTFRLF
jgi:hypothetical protein